MLEAAFSASHASGSTRSPACNSCRSTPSISFWPWRSHESPLLEVAETLLMMPDLFGWLLTGRRAGERHQCLDDAVARPAHRPLVRRAVPRPGVAPRDLARADRARHRAGSACVGRSPRRSGWLAPVTVIAPATHDTASAVAAVPAHVQFTVQRHRSSSGAAGLVLPQLGDLVAAGRRGPASGDQRRDDEV